MQLCLTATWLAVSALLGASRPAQGKEASKSGLAHSGTVELGLDGLLGLDNDSNTAAYVNLTAGYFVMSGLEVGLETLQGTTPEGQRDTFGVFTEYDYANSTAFIPFGGGGFKHAGPSTGESQDAKIVMLYGGSKIVLASDVALSLTLKGQFADHDTFGLPGARKSRSRDLSLGLKFFF